MQKVDVMGVSIDDISLNEAVSRVLSLAADISARSTIAFVNADCLNIAQRDSDYRDILSGADLVFGDGSGVRYAARLLGTPISDNVNGTDLFPLLCESAAEQGSSIYFLGGQPGVAELAAERAQRRYPGLQVAGCCHGFQESWDQTVKDINASKADILLVAMGVPHQEKWIADYRTELQVPVAIGVGGLFDFAAKQVDRAPRWIRMLGFEWLVRLKNEPRRLCYRYLIGNPLFLYRVCCARLKSQPLPGSTPNTVTLNRIDSWQDFELLDQVEHKYENLMSNPKRLAHSVGQRFYGIRQFFMQKRFSAGKRLLDMFVSATAILALAPVFIVTALAILLENPGPVFYCQQRVGKYGRVFSMYKFRSMIANADQLKAELLEQNESSAGVIFKMKSDPRITRVGRIIRRLSIDELPQLVNVLKGDMTLVGPRPPVPSEVAEYSLEERQRLDVTPGITCIWQVSGRSDIDFNGQVDLDLTYIHSRSLKGDIKLLLRTIPAVLTGKGAY